MIGAEEQNGPTCFTSLPAYARKLGSLSESALPIVPTGTTLSARGLKFQAPHSFFGAVAAILFEAPVNAAPPSLRATPPCRDAWRSSGPRRASSTTSWREQKRMRRLIKSRARQFVAASADPPFYIRFAGLIMACGQTQGSADTPRFAEPLRSSLGKREPSGV